MKHKNPSQIHGVTKKLRTKQKLNDRSILLLPSWYANYAKKPCKKGKLQNTNNTFYTDRHKPQLM